MKGFSTLKGTAVPLPFANIDTDQILPKQFLTTISRKGLAEGFFYDFRFAPDGTEIADFILNQTAYRHASILVAGKNFGCGSSREHAPWAMVDFGIRCVIAPSFAEIFYNNCLNNGILPVTLPETEVSALAVEATQATGQFIIDLATQKLVSPSGRVSAFTMAQKDRTKMLNGLDPIDETLAHEAEIAHFENRRTKMMVQA